jgi:hypothetical protein
VQQNKPTLTSILSLREGEEVQTRFQTPAKIYFDNKIKNPLPFSKGEGRVRVPIE